MEEHEITVHDIRHVEASMEFIGNALSEDEILRTNTHDNSTRQFNCSCGEEDMNYIEAVEHMEEQNDTISPDTFMEIGENLWQGDAIPTGRRKNGFILEGQVPQTDYHDNPLRSGAIVGYEMGDKYVVGLMHRKSETVGQNDYKLKTRENVYLKCSLYEVEFDGIVENAPRVGEYTVEHGDKIDDGYINGYRLTSLGSVLKEIFKYHNT